MRRIEIINGIDELAQAINVSNLEAAVKAIRSVSLKETLPKDLVSAVLNSLKQYSIMAEKFSDPAKSLEAILDLDRLREPTEWVNLFATGDQGRDARIYVQELVRTISFVKTYLPKLRHLLLPTTVQKVSEAKDQRSPYWGKTILSVILIEERDLSRPARLVNALESIELLFQACAIVTDDPSASVTVVACDSGSDKSFDFLGAAKVMEAVRDVILSLWDRIVFYRELQVSERLELVGKSLPIMEKIAILEEQKRIGPEQAELLRRDVLSGVTKFAESGATIPELEERSHFDPRLLLSPVQKLLVASQEDVAFQENTEQDEPADSESSPEPFSSESEGRDNFNEHEVSELRKLLKSRRQIESEDSEADDES